MFNNNTEIIYYMYERNSYGNRIVKLGNKESFIMILASYWIKDYFSEKYDNPIFTSFFCSNKEETNDKFYQFFDNYHRIINPIDYKNISFQYFLLGKTLRKNVFSSLRYYQRYYQKIKRKSYYRFRYDSVPYIHKWRGGSSQKPQKVKHILFALEDKEFSRGSKKDIPIWWDDKFKQRDIKNWKHQSKCRHQWQRGMKDQWLGQ